MPIGHGGDVLGLRGEDDVRETRGHCLGARLLNEHGACNAADQRFDIVKHRRWKRSQQCQVRNCHASAGSEDTRNFFPHARLVRREVEDAVGDHHINAAVGNRKAFDLTEAELHIGEPGLPRVCGHIAARLGDHVRSHIDTDHFASGADLWTSHKAVEPAACAKIQHHFASAE